MFPKSRGSLLALGSLLGLTTLGSSGCCSVRCCDTKPRDQLVVVTTKSATEDEVPNPEVVISKVKNHQIVWLLPSGSTIQHIKLELRPNQPSSPGVKWPPFEVCGSDASVCSIPCIDLICRSGRINPMLEPPKKGLYYDYKFSRAEGQASLDPGIRIDP
jgi:hypothetical protein